MDALSKGPGPLRGVLSLGYLFFIRACGAHPFGAGFAVRALRAQWTSKEK
jgi:hypothetical protein